MYLKIHSLFHELKEFSKEMKEISLTGDFLKRPETGRSEIVNELKDSFSKLLRQATDIVAENVQKDVELRVKDKELQLTMKLKETVEELNKEITRTNLLLRVARELVSHLELEELLHSITSSIGKMLGYSHFAILLKTEKDTLRVVDVYGLNEEIKGVEFSPGEGVSYETLRTGKPVYVPDTEKEKRYLFYKGKMKERGSFLSIPIKVEKDIVGVMNFHSLKVGDFSEKDVEILLGLADLTGIAIHNATLYEKIKELSHIDELTGTFNRRFIISKLDEEIKNCMRSENPLTVAMMDFDNFKSVNDNYGHLTGDEILKYAVGKIKSALRSTDFLGRYGGDEFLIILPFTDEEGANRVKDKIMNVLSSHPFTLENGKKIHVSVTISLRVYLPSELRKKTLQDIVKDVDEILIRMKKEKE